MTQNPSSLYGGFAVKFDSTPFVRYAMNQAAREQAKNEALDRGFAEELSKATPTGVRNTELPAFEHAKNDYQKFWIDNKDKIRKGDIDTMTKLYEKKNTLSNVLATSKSAYEVSKMGMDMKLKHQDKMDLWEDESVAALEKHTKPIYLLGENGKPKTDANGNLQLNPEWKAFDFSTVKTHLKGLSAKETDGVFDGIIKSEKPLDIKTSRRQDPDDKYAFYETSVGYHTKDQKKKIADIAKSMYKSDKEFAYTIDKSHPFNSAEGSKHSEDFDVLDQMHKDVYGKGIENKEDFAAAEAIRRMNGGITGDEKRVKNEQLQTEDQQNFTRAQQARSQAFQRSQTLLSHSLSKAEKSNDNQEYNSVIDKIIGDADDHAMKNPKIRFGDPSLEPAGAEAHYEVPLSPILRKAFNFEDGRSIMRLNLSVMPDGKKVYTPIYRRYDITKDATGKLDYVPTKGVDKSISVPLDEGQLKQILGYKILTKKDFKDDQLKDGGKKPPPVRTTTNILSKGKVR